MAMNSGPTDEQGIGGELAGGDRGAGGLDRAEEARVGDVGNPRPAEQPDTGATAAGGDPELMGDRDETTANRASGSSGAPSGPAPDLSTINAGDGPGQTPGE